MKIDRLIGILTILLQRGKLTAPELAERFEVSRRTISRDIEALCQAGIPIITAQGCGGGISIAEGFQLEGRLFTADELQTLLAGVRGIDSVSDTPDLDRLREKLSNPSRSFCDDELLLIDLASHYKKPLTKKFGVIKRAIQEKRLISFTYFYEKGVSMRTIEPYQLLFKWSSWYVYGYCLYRKDFRLFKLNRISELEAENRAFSPRPLPQTTDPDVYFSVQPFHLKARFAQSELYRLVEEYGAKCYTEEADGRLLLERDFVSYENMREWISSFGDRVEVLEPERLRRELCTQAKNIIKLYEDT